MPFDVPITSDNILESNELFSLFIAPESMPYFFSRGNPGTINVIILNDDGKQYLHICMCNYTCINMCKCLMDIR